MIKITKAEKAALLKQFTKRAKALAFQKDPEMDYHYFLSQEKITCYYSSSWPVYHEAPAEYNKYLKRGVVHLIHFLPQNCQDVCYHSEEMADCLATIRKGNTYHFYHCQHLVGDCPHKFNSIIGEPK